MSYMDYLAALRSAAAPAELREYGVVRERESDYPLVCVRTAGPVELVVTAGFHGEEPAGPLTLKHHLADILRHAERARVGLSIYPCINPSGFEGGHRYNASGERPNNDFLRYELMDGAWVGEMQPGQAFRRWSVYEGGPKETRALRAELERRPTPLAALDLHQDASLPSVEVYAYIFGPKAIYLPLMEASARHAAVARQEQVDVKARTDEDGFIELSDGSVTDYFHRRGVRYLAALETTTRTPLAAAEQVNLAWIHGFIELAAAHAGP